MSVDDNQARTFTLFSISDVEFCKFALRGLDGKLRIIKKVFKAVRKIPSMDAGKHCFLVYLENNEFCFVEAERLFSIEWRITKQSSSFSLDKFSSQIAVCFDLRRVFDHWWRETMGLAYEDLYMIRKLALDPV